MKPSPLRAALELHAPSDAREAAPRFRFFVLSCRDPQTDFRAPLANALRDRGHEVYYVRFEGRKFAVESGRSRPTESFGLWQLIGSMRRLTQDGVPAVYFNTTNLRHPILTVVLKFCVGRGIWCFDMHDDLLYDYRGMRRVVAQMRQAVLLLSSDVVISAAVMLRELFPHSIRLGNASSVRLLKRSAADFGKILIISSLDERFDFDLLGEAADLCPGQRFDLYGQVARDAAKSRLDALCQAHPNIAYKGPYVAADLENILRRYVVTFAPYRMNSRHTRYLDPLRYYHCLNSGMEVISTDIPQAHMLADAIHIVGSAREFADVLARLRLRTEARKNSGASYTLRGWEERAEQLVAILALTPKARALRSRQEPSGESGFEPRRIL